MVAFAWSILLLCTDGHALNVNAARDDQAYFQLADPWMEYADPSDNPFYQNSYAL